MIFNDITGTDSGICNDINFLVNADDNSYPLNDKCRNVNRAYDEAISAILEADGRWQFDDSNSTDLPIATTDLVANQQDYSFSSEFLIVSRVEVKDQAGNWRALKPIDENDVVRDGSSLTDFMKDAGLPQYYDKRANSMFLYPKPSFAQADSLKVFFQRNISYFVPTDTTKTPGFNQQFHRLLSAKAALDYALAKNLPQGLPHGRIPNALTTMIQRLEDDLKSYYSRKSKDENLTLRGRRWKFF